MVSNCNLIQLPKLSKLPTFANNTHVFVHYYYLYTMPVSGGNSVERIFILNRQILTLSMACGYLFEIF